MRAAFSKAFQLSLQLLQTLYFSVFILCRIDSQATSFCFFSFFCDIFFFWMSSSSGLGKTFYFSVKDHHLSMAGRAHGWVRLTRSPISSTLHLWGFVHLDVLSDSQ